MDGLFTRLGDDVWTEFLQVLDDFAEVSELEHRILT